ncbi:amidohydrolase family protein [Aquabacterium sp.]|uniref:amidohydrolase family protein n=1 Tax=Aquabacterium sp. TaxID=1872578 RepID=UPI003D6D2D18
MVPELLAEWTALLEALPEGLDPAFASLYGKLFHSPVGQVISGKLLDVDASRLAAMQEAHIDFAILSLTAPGVQLFAAAKANDYSRKVNDFLAAVVARHPDRYAGLATFSPLDPQGAVQELRRCASELGLCGALINSHTQGRYLDAPEQAPVLAALEELGLPLYLHPQTPSPAMAAPYLAYGLEGPGWGFAAETGLHAMRMILGGVFDRHPNLKVVLGHLGEGIPWWFSRIDSRFQMAAHFKGAGVRLKKPPSEYFKTNFYVTTSGMSDDKNMKFAIDAVGVDHVLFATDHPYENMGQASQSLDGLNVDPAAKAKISSRNAIKLFRLDLQT